MMSETRRLTPLSREWNLGDSDSDICMPDSPTTRVNLGSRSRLCRKPKAIDTKLIQGLRVMAAAKDISNRPDYVDSVPSLSILLSKLSGPYWKSWKVLIGVLVVIFLLVG